MLNHFSLAELDFKQIKQNSNLYLYLINYIKNGTLIH